MEKRARKKKSGGLWIHLFLVAFCVFVVAGVYWQYREYRQLKVELADVEQQIADEQQKTLDFQAKKGLLQQRQLHRTDRQRKTGAGQEQ